MKKKIAIAMGGYSSEYKVSIQSGNEVYKNIDLEKFEVYKAYIYKEEWFILSDKGEKHLINKADFSIEIKGEKIKFDGIFNIIHGTPGEDGLFSAYLEILQLPQTSSGFYESALTFNKRDCIKVLDTYGFKTAQNYTLQKGDTIDEDAILKRVGLPCFVKANRSGSSFGISKVYQKSELQEAINFSFDEDNEIIIESFLQGTEVSVGVVNFKGKIKALPVTEIVTGNDFFDYKAKYLGQSQEITPARITEKQTRDVQQQTEAIYKLLNLKGFARAEFIFHKDKPHFIEVNTCPGMTAASIVPQQIEAAGISLQDFYTDLIDQCISV